MHTYKYPELELARNDMQQQNPLYQPSAFWSEASSKIVDELCHHGVENFRALPKPLAFFVPTYGFPGSGFNKEQAGWLLDSFGKQYPTNIKPLHSLEQFLSGYSAALADYRTLIAADDISRQPFLHQFSESDVGRPVEHWEFEGKRYSRSAFNYLLGLAWLKQYLDEPPLTVLEIGGGFGTLGEVLLSSGLPGMRYIDIDIPPTSFVAQSYLSAVLGQNNVATYAGLRDAETIAIDQLPSASVLASWQIERLQGKVDLFVNFISFQEMEPEIVRNYLHHVTRLQAKWVLLRNMREGKQVRTANSHVGVETPILRDDYVQMLPEYELVATNVWPFGYKTVDGFHSELLLLKRKTFA